MVKKDYLMFSLSGCRKLYDANFPQLVALAIENETIESFKVALSAYISSYVSIEEHEYDLRKAAEQRIQYLIHYDTVTVDELSTGESLLIQTLTYFWQFLRGEIQTAVSPDLYIDLYYLFKELEHPGTISRSREMQKKQMNRWPTGLDIEVMNIQENNKERIIDCLIKKIEKRQSENSKYHFKNGLTEEEKHNLVNQWWQTNHFHLAMAIKSPAELNFFLGYTLSQEVMEVLTKAKKKGMPFFVTPYYLSLLNPEEEGYDDATIRTYILYSDKLVDTYGEIKAWEKEDVVEEGKPNAAGWLIPGGHNIHRRYPEVAIMIPDSTGRACGGLCASCQRMYDFQSERLNFDFESLRPKESWEKKLRRLMHYFEEDTQLRDILITGGDALMSQDNTLRRILDAVYAMAQRKRNANKKRADGEKFAEIQRVRLGSRLPAYLPFRITDQLVDILRDFKEKASGIGITQFFLQTHFQSPLEMTPEARHAIRAIRSAGWTVTNQLVYTVSASRRGHTAKLRQTLNREGVVCYYTFSVKGFQENYTVFTPISRSLQEQQEEKIFGRIPDEKKEELNEIICKPEELDRNLQKFLKENHLLFASTDRSVLNLPAIGKSMTFRTIGLTEKGQRILKFSHDHSRRHSPIIDQMKEVYIVENKSVAAYLRELQAMGEDLREYTSIWNYSEGETEPRFRIFEYPEYTFATTDKMTNLKLD